MSVLTFLFGEVLYEMATGALRSAATRISCIRRRRSRPPNPIRRNSKAS